MIGALSLKIFAGALVAECLLNLVVYISYKYAEGYAERVTELTNDGVLDNCLSE